MRHNEPKFIAVVSTPDGNFGFSGDTFEEVDAKLYVYVVQRWGNMGGEPLPTDVSKAISQYFENVHREFLHRAYIDKGKQQ